MICQYIMLIINSIPSPAHLPFSSIFSSSCCFPFHLFLSLVICSHYLLIFPFTSYFFISSNLFTSVLFSHHFFHYRLISPYPFFFSSLCICRSLNGVEYFPSDFFFTDGFEVSLLSTINMISHL